MYFDTCEVAPLMTNCYLIGDEVEKVCAVVDPGGSPERVLAMIEKSGMELKMILLTHGHYDHVRGIPGVLEKYPQVPIYVHPAELGKPDDWKERYFVPHQGDNQRTYDEGDVLQLGSLEIRVLVTPGHTAGSVVLLVEDFMFAGDTIFALSCGRCDLPGGSEDAMYDSLARLARLEGDYKILSGHGRASQLSRERKYNTYMKYALER